MAHQPGTGRVGEQHALAVVNQHGVAAGGHQLAFVAFYLGGQRHGLVALVLVVLALIIGRFPLPAMGKATARISDGVAKTGTAWIRFVTHPMWRHRNLVWGVPAIFIYLIAEIGVANLFINFVSQPEIGNMTHAQAANYLVLLWGGMMVGRFAGAFIMRKAQP